MRASARTPRPGQLAVPLSRGWHLPEAGHVRIAWVAAALSLLVMAGWAADYPFLTTFLPGRPSMVPMTALAVLLAAWALACVRQRQRARRLALVQLCSGMVFIVSARHVPVDAAQTLLSWPSPLTGTALVVSAVSTWLLASRLQWQGQALAFVNLLFAALIGIGHVFPIADLYQYLPRAGVAVPTILAFLLLCVGQLLAFPDEGVVAALTSRNTAGRAGLRLIVAGFAVPLLLCIFLVLAFRGRLFDGETAVMLMAWSAMALLGSMLWALAVTVDRAQQAQAEAELQRNRLRQMVTAALTHDIRSPVQAAALSTDALLRLLPDGPTRPIVERLQRNHRRLDRLLRALLDGLSLDNGQETALRASHFDLGALVQEAVDENDARLGGRVKLQAERICGWWDRDALFRVIENILLNAVKYGAPGTEIRCTVATLPVGRVAVAVTNQGNPIPADEWESIFQPFSRGEAARSSGQVGWGVGLAYARVVLTRHGGDIRVQASDAQGTCFIVTLPTDARAFMERTII